jgi:hypothetical protein
VQTFLERYKKVIELHITGSSDDDLVLENAMDQFRLKSEKIRTIKKEGDSVFYYEVSGPKAELDRFLKTLNRNKTIKSFEY